MAKKGFLFNEVQIRKPSRNVFDLSHERKQSFNMGELIPFFIEEVIPGDKFRVKNESLIRLAPMVSPVMHRMNVHKYFFYVPNRLVYDEWQNYITGGSDGTANPAFPVVTITDAVKAQFAEGTLADYLGVPSPPAGTITQNLAVNALPFRMYQLIYNEYFRDQTLTTAVALTQNTTVDATEQTAITTLRKKSWEKDYFTSAMTQSQRGTEVNLPIVNTTNYLSQSLVKTTAGANINANTGAGTGSSAGGFSAGKTTGVTESGINARLENISSIDSQLTINNLRRATRLQQWLERNALGGARYIEQILAHFNVRTSDFRFQRPEFLGGSKEPIVVSEVLSTAETGGEYVGNMAGHGISVGSGAGFSRYFEEHGFIIGIMCVLPRTSYQQGLPRMFSRADRYEYAWPEFAHIGEQAIRKKELYYDISSAVNDNTFGYTPRYAEYKFKGDSVHGEFKSSLYHWHMGRIFSSNPSLNAAFVEADPTNRIFAVVDSSDKLWCQLYNDVRVVRSLPLFGEPSM